jgi:stage V sporulation protein S
MSIIKVSARSRTASVAGAIAGVVREAGKAEVQAIGAGAVNQSVKAIAIATNYLAEEEVYVICVPSFAEVLIDDQERTAIRILVEPR